MIPSHLHSKPTDKLPARPASKIRKGGQCIALAAALSLGVFEVVQFCFTSKLFADAAWATGSRYWSSLVTSCSTLLAWASAAMPVWLRISYFDIFEVAAAKSVA